MVGSFEADEVGGNVADEYYAPSILAGLHGMNRNAQFALPGPYNTQLGPFQQLFNQWVAQNHVPITPDYDMQGFFQALMKGQAQTAIDPFDKRLHYSDIGKRPQHETFSRESKYAKPNAPYWVDNRRLLDERGRLIFEDK